MPLYKCQYCDFSSFHKKKYFTHLSSAKHDIDNTMLSSDNISNSILAQSSPIFTPNDPDFGLFSTVLGQNSEPVDPFSPQISKMISEEIKLINENQ